MTMPSKVFYLRIKTHDPVLIELDRIMREKRLTLTELSRRSGVTDACIRDWGARTSPRLANLVAVAEALGYRVKLEPIND
jgi:hypothetical protein